MTQRLHNLLVACAALSVMACQSVPSSRQLARPIVTDGAINAGSSARQLPELPALSKAPARINCRASLSKDDELSRAVVEERLRAGSHYAALAQIQALPADQADVAILRADILRRLQRPEALSWYRALVGSCKAAQAEQGLGLLAAQAGDYLNAITRLQAAAKAAPADARIRNDLGYLYLHVGQDSGAEFELRTASELAGNDRTPQVNLLLLALLRGDNAAWQAGRQSLAPDARERTDLSRQCQHLMRLRSVYREGRKPPEVMKCLINPQL